MRRKSPPIPAGDHGPQRRGIHHEHENDVHDEKAGEDPHCPEMPVPCRLESAEQGGEPGELRRLVDRESREDRQDAQQNNEGVRELLERIVLSLRRVILAQPEEVLLHLDRPADIARPKQQRPPLAAHDEIRQVHHAARDQRPHQREVPVQSAREPSAQPAPARKAMPFERIHVGRTVALAEACVRGINLQPAHDHTGEHHERQPMRQAHNPMMSFDRFRFGPCRGRGRGRGRRFRDRSASHALSIFSDMRAATLLAITCLVSCRSQQAAVTTGSADSLSFAEVASADSADSVLLKPRVVTEPTVVVFWLAAADTFSADDQAEALDELNSTTEGIAATLARHNIKLVPTNSDTIYVALPNRQRRTILLTGVDYPFGYVLVEPGAAERILAGLYADDELLDEVQAYFDLPPSDSVDAKPRIST